MKVVEKLSYLQKCSGFAEKKFCKINGFPIQLYWQWMNGLSTPTVNDVRYLCEKNNLDVDDFMNESSTISTSLIKDGEHVCKLIHVNESLDNHEDFPHESNDRYEEKD